MGLDRREWAGGGSRRAGGPVDMDGKGVTKFMTNADFDGVPEIGLCSKTGLSREELVKRRGVRCIDWEIVGKNVLWSEKAAAALLASLSPLDVGPCIDSKNAPVPTVVEMVRQFEEEKAVVIRGFVNPTIIECRLEASDELVCVRVRDGRMFPPGWSIPVRKIGDRWELARTNPRWRGKW
jgi:hypothetical protein